MSGGSTGPDSDEDTSGAGRGVRVVGLAQRRDREPVTNRSAAGCESPRGPEAAVGSHVGNPDGLSDTRDADAQPQELPDGDVATEHAPADRDLRGPAGVGRVDVESDSCWNDQPY